MCSFLLQNSFRDNFNAAIGVIGTTGLAVEDNIIHGTVDAGIRVKSTDVSLTRNLVSFTMARACYQDRVEADNFFYHGSIEVSKSYPSCKSDMLDDNTSIEQALHSITDTMCLKYLV